LLLEALAAIVVVHQAVAADVGGIITPHPLDHAMGLQEEMLGFSRPRTGNGNPGHRIALRGHPDENGHFKLALDLPAERVRQQPHLPDYLTIHQHRHVGIPDGVGDDLVLLQFQQWSTEPLLLGHHHHDQDQTVRVSGGTESFFSPWLPCDGRLRL